MKTMIKKLFTLVLMAIAFSGSFAQMSISAGPSIIKSFGIQGVYPAFHIGAEFSDDDTQTLFGRLTFSTPKSTSLANGPTVVAFDNSTVPYYYQLKAREKYSFVSFEAGKRYYFGDGYDSGFSPYGGSCINLVFNQIKLAYDSYDETKYAFEQGVNNETNGSIFALYFGLQGGVKKSFYFGTIYFDAGLSYALLAVPSNTVASNTENFRNLIFTFGLGFRKDFY